MRALTIGLLLLGLVAAPASADNHASLKSKHAVKIDKSKPFPAILFSDVLKSMSDQVVWEKGQIRFFERVRMAFLPPFKDPKKLPAYNPDTGAFLASVLTNGKGKVVSTVFWEAREDKFPVWQAHARNNSSPPTLEPGSYTWTWHIDGQPFWKLPFKVVRDKAADEYSQAKTYIEGPWNDWGYIYVPRGNVNQTPTFNFFLRDKSASPGKWVRTFVEIEVRKGRKLVAQAGKNKGTRVDAKPWWIATEVALRSADDKGFAKAVDLLSGSYTITLKLNGKKVGTYKYKAKKGKIPFVGRQDRKKAAPMTYLEGMRDRFYVERK